MMRKSIYRFFIIAVFLLGFLTGFLLVKNPLALRLFIVESGSMQPAFSPGSVVFTLKSHYYRIGDIVTFSRPIGQTLFVTHRIVDIDGQNIITKGDANNAADDGYISKDKILGKMWVAIPYLGFFLIFMRTLPGIATFILVPSFIIIFREILNIKKELHRRSVKSVVVSSFVMMGVGLFAAQIAATNSFYSQQKLFFSSKVEMVAKEKILAASLDSTKHELTVKIENLSSSAGKISYEITYQTKDKQQGIKGEVIFDNPDSSWEKTFVLGTCSAGGVCVFDEEVKDIIVTVNITDDSGDHILTQNVQN